MHLHKQVNFSPWGVGLIFTFIGLVIGLDQTSNAQPLPDTPPTPNGVAQISISNTTFRNTVESYLLNREGIVDGLLLKNGLIVKFPPSMAVSLVNTIKPGDRVTVVGSPRTPSNFGQEVRAYSITNIDTGHTLVNQPPVYPPSPPTYVNYSNLFVEGRARRWLVGRRGEINGVLLSNQAQVMFPPTVGYQLFNQAREGVRVKAQGVGVSNRYGKILTATSLTVDGQTVPIPSSAPQAYGPPGPRKGPRAGRGIDPQSAYGSPPVPAPAPPPR